MQANSQTKVLCWQHTGQHTCRKAIKQGRMALTKLPAGPLRSSLRGVRGLAVGLLGAALTAAAAWGAGLSSVAKASALLRLRDTPADFLGATQSTSSELSLGDLGALRGTAAAAPAAAAAATSAAASWSRAPNLRVWGWVKNVELPAEAMGELVRLARTSAASNMSFVEEERSIRGCRTDSGQHVVSAVQQSSVLNVFGAC